MKKLLSVLALWVSVWGAPNHFSSIYSKIPSHQCDNAAFTVLEIAEQQPRTILSWIKDAVVIDQTAIVEVGSWDLLVHGKSTIFLPPIYFDCYGQPFLMCTPTTLREEAIAHGYINEDDGTISLGLENLLKMYQPEDPKFEEKAHIETPPIHKIGLSEWDALVCGRGVENAN